MIEDSVFTMDMDLVCKEYIEMLSTGDFRINEKNDMGL